MSELLDTWMNETLWNLNIRLYPEGKIIVVQ
jgi:hypothetical protein